MNKKKFENIDLEIFSKRLKEAMCDCKLNNCELSKRTGFSNQAISLWLNQKREPKLSALKMLAKELNCSIDFLAGLKDE